MPDGRLLAGVVAAAMVFAACGTDTTETATGAENATESSAQASTDSGTTAETVASEAGAAEGDATASSSFPNLDTVNIATGESVNLAAELAGGTTPVMLWFFAPH